MSKLLSNKHNCCLWDVILRYVTVQSHMLLPDDYDSKLVCKCRCVCWQWNWSRFRRGNNHDTLGCTSTLCWCSRTERSMWCSISDRTHMLLCALQ